jgi:hypothetical protein
MTSHKAALFLALVASAAGVILRGPSAVSDTYIRNLYPTWNLNTETQAWWDGPLTISATQVISGVTTDTSALLIKFDLRSFVGATLVPNKTAWLNYFVSDSGHTASLRELVVPWNEVRTPTAKPRALPSQPRAVPWLRPLPADAPLSAPPCFRQSTVTWNNLPFASASWRPTNVPSGTTGTFPGVLGWNRFDVTSSVAAWLAGSRVNNGWIVLPTGGSNGVGVEMTNALNRSQTPYLDFEPLTPPSAPPPPPSPTQPPPPPAFSYVFNGENSSYTGGCQSTKIASDSPDYNGGQQTTVEWDGSSITTHYDSALVQFTDIIGLGPNQLRPHEQIQRATLRYFVDTNFSTNAVGATAQVHEISTAWNANTTTFRTFVGAQGLNEPEYRTPAIATAFATRAGWYEIDVTASVRSWVSRVNTNNGWIWMPSPQNLGGSSDGSQMRACSAPPNVRVNLVVLAALQPPRPPSPPARPPPPPARPPPPPPPPRAPFTVMTIRNAEHARLRMVAPDTNYATATETVWDGNSACAPAAHKPLAKSAAAPAGLIPTSFRSCAHTRVCTSPPLTTCRPQDRCRFRADEVRPERALGHGSHLPRALPLHRFKPW